MEILADIPLLEKILAPWQETMGSNYQPYKNHVYRVVNFCLMLHQCTPDDREKSIVAGCFHDLGIWTDKTVDYLAPSVKLAKKYLKENSQEQWSNEIELMIERHHQITKYRNSEYPLVEVFRKADWVDVSKGIRSFGLSKHDIQKVLDTFPNLGFHQILFNLAKAELLTYRRNPLPMMKW
ncbi:HD domain-containing protein [Planktothrix sp. FACHB-1355]|uniref:HD domain-containing protein n=1 Tax=Aerosakkonema funiforme FACHB-1375 TaxID=2949571 RepID=A0A926ZJ38_9CYAN|nr:MULTISPECIES: HD domain-containing protein [Oscillatoriales]MBD2182481.1 HD domain-containing protein [Aerosakkonema funiforme FACHB-1375]MBD3562152.1 HD domain-containing protein [Planktothrix sp. FACHB-1355]